MAATVAVELTPYWRTTSGITCKLGPIPEEKNRSVTFMPSVVRSRKPDVWKQESKYEQNAIVHGIYMYRFDRQTRPFVHAASLSDRLFSAAFIFQMQMVTLIDQRYASSMAEWTCPSQWLGKHCLRLLIITQADRLTTLLIFSYSKY